MKYIIFLIIIFPKLLWGASALSYLPIQDGGRIKPLDSFARETMQLLYGKKSFRGKDATEFLIACLAAPDTCRKEKLFQIRNFEVKKSLQINENENYFSSEELLGNPHLGTLFSELRTKRESSSSKLEPFFESIHQLENQLSLYHGVITGVALKIVPPEKGDAWIDYIHFTEPLRENFHQILKSFATSLNKKDSLELDRAIHQFMELAKAQNPTLYPLESKMKWEVHYNQFQPFLIAWICYLMAILLLVFSKKIYQILSWVFIISGIFFHSYGFGLRVFLTERAPVSNMYETVVWVAWGALFFSIILFIWLKNRVVLFSGLAISVFCLILADLAPTILDPTLQPLMPVLRSNFWLTVHVLVITISYAAFFLALGMSDWGLFYFIKGESRYKNQIQEVSNILYRSLQIGVVLLAAGIILGGIWADYSWGRFWGWDPKETWALIALLGYLALLHGRLAGWLRNYGMMVGSILAFSLVIMAWYGVNYVLGAGLHSYGFGAGGLGYVLIFVAIQVGYIIFSYIVRKKEPSSIR